MINERDNQMENKFYMVVGLPGSGKSYLANQVLKELDEKTIWLSSDKIREELYGSEEEQGDPSKVFGEMRIRTEKALQDGWNVVYDACNINSKKRIAFLNNLKRYRCEKNCILCATPYEMCLERNKKRDRFVPEAVIRQMYMNWNTPYFFEGWDHIYVQYAEGTKGSLGTVKNFVEKQMDFKQENPHHLETLGEHLRETASYLKEQYGYQEYSNMIIAALLHDCGKSFAKVFTDKRGNKTEIAHYYQHQCNGAYDVLFYEIENKNTEDMLEISMLVNLHMAPFGWESVEKGSPKQKKLWGEKIYEEIKQIHAADEASSHSESEI